jgi:hypothetical protein
VLNAEEGDLGPKVFFVWGSLCVVACLWAYFLVYETKGLPNMRLLSPDPLTDSHFAGLSLEQIDRLHQETTPRHSTKWIQTTTFAEEMGMTSMTAEMKPGVIMTEDRELSPSV